MKNVKKMKFTRCLFVFFLAFLFFENTKLFSETSDDDSDDGGWEWSEPEYSNEDGWDGTENTPNSPNDEPPVDGWGDDSEPYDGSYCYVSDDDGSLSELYYEDVYDEEGNRIYHNEDEDVEERVYEHFYDEWISRTGKDSDSFAKYYSDAVKALETALLNGVEKEIADAKAKVDEALAELVQYCEHFNYSWTANGSAVGIYDGNHKTVAHVGDPVIIALGKFVIDDADISISNGILSFSLERHYVSLGKVENSRGIEKKNHLERKNGAFGLLWNSNLDTRIIRGENSFAEEIIEKLKNYAAELSEAETLIENYANEDSECEPVVEEIRLEIARNSENLAYFEAELEKNKISSSFNRFTDYGIAGGFNGSLNSEILIYCGDNGEIVLFEKSDNVNSYYPVSKSWKNKIALEVLETDFSDDKNDKKFAVKFLNTGEKRFYSSFGLPVLFEKSGGASIQFEYDENFLLSKISLDSEHFLEFSWSDGLLAFVSDGWRKISYSYDGENLVSVTDFDGDTRFFEYDDEGFLTKQVKADGSFVAVKYKNLENGKYVSAVTDENGKSEYFEYDFQNRKTIYTNPDGAKTVYFYDEVERTEKILHSDGREENFSYDENGNLVEWNNGSIFAHYVRDSSGKIIEETDEFGAVETFTYDEERLVSRKNKCGTVENYNYDDKKRITDVYLNGEILKSFAYDENGRVEKETDCRGNIFLYFYDSRGNLSEIKLQEKGKNLRSLETFEYDFQNRIKKHVGRDGITKKFTYENHKIVVSCSNSVRVMRNYSSRKLIISEKIEDLLTNENFEKFYEYDKAGRCAAVYVFGKTAEFGKNKNVLKRNDIKKILLNEFEYTSGGKISRKTVWNISESAASGKSGTEILYRYDSSGNLCEIVKRKIKNGDIKSEKTTKIAMKSDGFSNEVTEICGKAEKVFSYDFRGNLLSEKNGNAVVYSSEYDFSGKLISQKFGAFEKLNYEYDADGFLSSILKENFDKDSSCEVFYYPDGKMRESVDLNGNVTSYEYNGFGMLVRAASPFRISEYEYDDCGKLISRRILDSEKRVIYEECWIYSGFGRKVIHKIGGKLVDKLVKNGFGMLICKEDSVENLWTYSNDILGRKISETNPYGKKTFFEWNENNLLEKITCPDGNIKKFLYDLDFNCLEISDNAGILQKCEYDDYGRLSSFWKRPFSSPEKYEYDDYGRVLRVSQAGKNLLTNFYDDSKMQINRKDSLGNISEWKFDIGGNLVSSKNRNGVFSVNEWKNGKLKFSRDFNGLESTFFYGDGGFLSRVVFSNGEKFSSAYNALGKLVFAENENSSLSFEYDSAGNLIHQKDNFSGEEIYFEYENGKLSKIYGDERKIFYSYGKCGELLKIQENSGVNSGQISEISFSYDSCGREILRKWNSGETLKIFYDEVGREILRAGFSSSNGLIFLEGFVYDKNGFKSLVLESDFSYTRYEYDDFGRIKSVSAPYSERRAEYLKSCVAQANLYLLGGSENFSYESLSSIEYESLKKLCDFVGVNLSSGAKKYIKESFEYDLNSNLVKRITPFGKISYKYDKNDRLVAWGNGCAAEYDLNGNMISMTAPQKSMSFEYNASNRIKKIIIKDFLKDEIVSASYEYDALGRRTKSFVSGNGTSAVSYIGKTRQEFLSVFSPYALQSSSSKTRSGKMEEKSIIRYKFWLGSQNFARSEISPSDENQDASEYSDFRTEKSSENYFASKSAPVFALDGELLWLSSTLDEAGSEKNVFLTSKNGTVKSFVNADDVFSSFEYDLFGFPLCSPDEKSVAGQYGFAGKKFDSETGLYDFGCRDYLSLFGRFSSEDPVLDGRNWYSYCGGDFVNFVDGNGLEMLYVEEQNMQSMDGERLGNSSSELASKAGCVVTCIAEILSAYTGVYVDSSFINDNKSNFLTGSGEIKWSGILDNYGLSHSKNDNLENLFSEILSNYANFGNSSAGKNSGKPYHDFIERLAEKDTAMETLRGFQNSDSLKAANIGNYINSIVYGSEKMAVVFQVVYDLKDSSALHFVVANGDMFIKDGISYFPVSPSSLNDRNVAAGTLRGMAGWIIQDGKVCVPASLINRIDVIKKGS